MTERGPGAATRLEPNLVGTGFSGGYADLLQWLDGFQQTHGRPLRVLHVGNIANNAYLNARFLRAAGVDCDVLCCDYYHIMACPEWEEVDIEEVPPDHLHPDWSAVVPDDYERPRWFVQGPGDLCLRYLEARARHDDEAQELLWQQLARFNGVAPPRAAGRADDELCSRPEGFPPSLPSQPLSWWVHDKLLALCSPARHASLLVRCFGRFLPSGTTAGSLVRRLGWAWVHTLSFAAQLGYRMLNHLPGQGVQQALLPSRVAGWAVERFDRCFPDRPDRLVPGDVAPYESVIRSYRALFDKYDVVQCYSVDPILGLLTQKRPYVAFEHGTLRVLTQGDVPLHRLTALAYRESDHTFITNGDCLEYAHRLGLERYSPMIHPLDVDAHAKRDEEALAALRQQLGGDVLLFCPLRHDWAVKGTDVYLRALPRLLAAVDGEITLVTCNWGEDLSRSRALAEELRVVDRIRWVPPMSRMQMIRMLQAADVVLDQIALPHFGATAPQALAAGTPVLMSYEPSSTEWLVSRPAPILAARTPEEVVSAVKKALDPAWRRDFAAQARSWIAEEHSIARAVGIQLAVYSRVLERAAVRGWTGAQRCA